MNKIGRPHTITCASLLVRGHKLQHLGHLLNPMDTSLPIPWSVCNKQNTHGFIFSGTCLYYYYDMIITTVEPPNNGHIGTFQLSLAIERLSSSRRSIYTQNVQLVHFCLSIIGGCPYLLYWRFHCILYDIAAV